MITIYSIDHGRNLVTHINADVHKRSVEAVTQTEPAFSINDFASHSAIPKSKKHDGSSGYEQDGVLASHEEAITAGSLMTSPLITLPADTSITDGMIVMEKYGIHHLPVTENGVVTGLTQKNDLSTTEDKAATLKTVSKPYLIAMQSIPASAIALAFLTHDWSACLIRSAEGVNGIVTLHDLLKALLPPLPDTDA